MYDYVATYACLLSHDGSATAEWNCCFAPHFGSAQCRLCFWPEASAPNLKNDESSYCKATAMKLFNPGVRTLGRRIYGR